MTETQKVFSTADSRFETEVAVSVKKKLIVLTHPFPFFKVVLYE